MKTRLILVLLAILLIAAPLIAQTEAPDDCDLDLLTEWLITRQVGWDRVYTVIWSGGGPVILKHYIPLVIQARHDLEDAERPACADEAYIATIGRYNAYLDHYLFTYAGIPVDQEAYQARFEKFNDLVQTTVVELESYVDVDIQAAAAEAVQDPEATD